ncbi:hypothetical protein V565_067910, partial [Rhizoctonia solani 123E]
MPPRKRKSESNLPAATENTPKRAKNTSADRSKKSKKREPSPPPPSSSPEPEEDIKPRNDHIDWQFEYEGNNLSALLLTEIEDNNAHRQILGFNTNGATIAKTTGDTQVKHHRTLARKVLFNHPSGKWANEPIERLATAVKNHINSLKSQYRMHRNALSETGQGIGSQAEVTVGSKLAGAFDEILKKFPQYWRMRDLLFQNPTFEPQLTLNGSSTVDVTTILATRVSDLEDEPELGDD